MNKKKLSIITAVSCLLIATGAEAKTLERLEVMQEISGNDVVAQITVSGTSEEQYVQLTVVKPDVDEESVDPDEENGLKNAYQILKNIKVNEDGTFSYTYPIENGVGEYVVYLEDDTDSFSLMSYDDLSGFFTDVNSDISDEALCGLFEANSTSLCLDVLTTCAYSKATLGSAIAKDKDFAKVSDAVASFEKHAAALVLSDADNEEKFLDIATKYHSRLALDKLPGYEIYAAFTDKQKTEVFLHLDQCNVKDYNTFCKNFSEQIILTAIAHTKSYGEVSSLLNENDDIIEIDWKTVLKSIKETSSVYKGMVGVYYSSTEELETAAKKFVAEQKKKENKNNNSSGGGGGSSSVGGGGAFADGRMPSSSGITVAPQQTPAQESEIFNDLQDALWAKDAIYALSKKQAISGMGDGSFAPNAEVTREQFVRTLVSAFGFTGSEDPGFSDVDVNAWYYESICIAYKNQIVMGIDEETFGIGKTLTREEMATLVYRALEKNGYSFEEAEAAVFTDFDSVSDYAKTAVSAMSNEGLINGFPEGNFLPGGLCTRAQMAVVISQACQKLAK